ncbi:Hydroxyacid oxidase 1 [Portunus trituberculatus]|uniref:Hydroxyacid oxidase 1 n=1 Tax=Portunus trituberculatus TaxID=210409 RepID=A0A5B7K4D9_PORTR|nr:Hydroxyacid oxidase 1 [Portunus trituberculatus]
MSKPLVGVHDYEREAQWRLPKTALDYYRSGALDEVTLKENKEAMNR